MQKSFSVNIAPVVLGPGAQAGNALAVQSSQLAGVAPHPPAAGQPPVHLEYSLPVGLEPPQLAAQTHLTGGLPLPTADAQKLQARLALTPAAAQPAAAPGSMVVNVDQWIALNKQLVDARAQLAFAQHEKSSSEALWRQLVSTFKIKREDVLSAAAATGNYTAILELSVPGAGFNQPDSAGSTPLHCAVRARRSDMAGFLLADQGIDPNIKSAEGFTALVYAIAGRDSEMVRLLLADPRVDPNIAFGEPQMPPLSLALLLKDPQTVDLLLASSGLHIDQSAFGGRSCRFDQVADSQGLTEIAVRIRAMIARINTATPTPMSASPPPQVQSPTADEGLDALPALMTRSPSFQYLLERIQSPLPILPGA